MRRDFVAAASGGVARAWSSARRMALWCVAPAAAQVRSAQAQLRDALTRRSRLAITAPVGGVVLTRDLPAAKVGDLLVFESCGAYHRTYSMNNFLTLGEATSYVY